MNRNPERERRGLGLDTSEHLKTYIIYWKIKALELNTLLVSVSCLVREDGSRTLDGDGCQLE
jgi:hypothetical protein